MDFITDEELDGCIVLILNLCYKRKNCPQKKKSKRFWVREVFKKRAAYRLNINLVRDRG